MVYKAMIKQSKLNCQLSRGILRIKEYENMGDYCVRLNTYANKMETLGEEVNNEFVVKKVFKTLIPK